jgi:hypothetical protein
MCLWQHTGCLLFSSIVLLGSVTGCTSDRTFPSAPTAVKQYWQLALNHHAVTLALTAPANQWQLTAVPLTAMGDTLATNARVHFTSSDSAVQVDSTGLLTAHSPKTGVLVIATLTVGGTQGVTLADTARVNVNSVPTIPVFSRIDVQTPGDSAKIAIQANGTLTVTMYDAFGVVIPGTNFYVDVQDTTIAGLSAFDAGGHWAGTLSGSSVGQTRVIVDATVYGIHKSDTLEMNIGYKIFQRYTLVLTSDSTVYFQIPDLTISPGGVVMFVNSTYGPTNIIFDDSTAAQSATYAQITTDFNGFVTCFAKFKCPADGSNEGNILALPSLDALKRHLVGFDFRRFPTRGTYPFHTRPFNATGVIHVE